VERASGPRGQKRSRRSRFQVDRTVQDANEADYDGLVLPGGVANPDFLRGDDDAVAFVRAFFDAQKPVAVIPAFCDKPAEEICEGRHASTSAS
jgi:putative intracellular protease/amidase